MLPVKLEKCAIEICSGIIVEIVSKKSEQINFSRVKKWTLYSQKKE